MAVTNTSVRNPVPSTFKNSRLISFSNVKRHFQLQAEECYVNTRNSRQVTSLGSASYVLHTKMAEAPLFGIRG